MAKEEEQEPEADRLLIPGRPDYDRVDNKVISARYTVYNFLPIAIMEQFRRFANLYFLIVGFIMFIGQYTPLFETAISPWTTWGPLAIVISISLSVEATADAKRHRNDEETNNAECVVIRRGDDIDQAEDAQRDEHVLGGRDVLVNVSKSYFQSIGSASKHGSSSELSNNVKVGFQKVRRMDIRQGQFVLIKNREMVPADIILLASSNDQGGAYIETSSIDGETNLKLRNSPRLPKDITRELNKSVKLETLQELEDDEEKGLEFETIEQAIKRITRLSALGHPNGTLVTDHPEYPSADVQMPPETGAEYSARRSSRFGGHNPRSLQHSMVAQRRDGKDGDEHYIATLVTEPPNASVHTFSGKLTLPPLEPGGHYHDIPLGAENVLLRGAVLRNTEWAIGLAFFTGTDTKLIQNSHKTPPKFSQLDVLMNKTVIVILVIMMSTITFLASNAVAEGRDSFETLFYAGYNKNLTEPWPYLPSSFAHPEWEDKTNNWLQSFLLYVTLLTNFVPLSLYVTVEVVTVCNLWFIYADLDMYDDTTDTRAVARSTIITDLGRVQYIFSDKTGTLTQNVMRFKRCSVDGMVFGAPIQKTRPVEADAEEDEPTSFHPLRQLLVGQFNQFKQIPGLENLGGQSSDESLKADNKLTFNAEMFLRVLCLCHTVVVEKDIDSKEDIDAGNSVSSKGSSRSGMSGLSARLFGRKRANTGDSFGGTPLSAVKEKVALDEKDFDAKMVRNRASSHDSFGPGQNPRDIQGPDGAPLGYAYQAESPDEGALVTAASATFGFQVVSRDSSGITVRTKFQSHLENVVTVKGIKSGRVSLKRLAAETASARPAPGEDKGVSQSLVTPKAIPEERRDEKWAILAVNKFDSDRKRMSILLRSPQELGSLPILFCKGADSAMLEPGVCSGAQVIQGSEPGSFANMPRPAAIHETHRREVSELTAVSETDEENENDNDNDNVVDHEGWEVAQMLGIQSHLGDFAKEGLRTLVLGMRILSEQECEKWLHEYKTAASSMSNRSEMLTEAAKKIERDLHIVGATAIEDKLQSGVPYTISQMEKAGIKLWVLTGDKRETAVEIGYSTHVLTPKMHLTEVPDNAEDYVRTQMAMEFIRLIKIGKLQEYQKVALGEQGPKSFKVKLAKFIFDFMRQYRLVKRLATKGFICLLILFALKKKAKDLKKKVEIWEEEEIEILEDVEKRRRTRARAEKIIQQWLESDQGKLMRKRTGMAKPKDDSDEDLSLASEELPAVFNRATSARLLLKNMRDSGTMSQPELRKLSIAALTAQQASSTDEEPLVDEDTLSLDSFFVGNGGPGTDFDKKKRTIFERLFAVDREVRKGHLRKHMTASKLRSIAEQSRDESCRGLKPSSLTAGPRALVIEGAALKSLLGDPELENILFAVASKCEAVIACRVSPKQKALLVSLVRRNVRPEPVTLAIGDGANDVGMIQEAHVGVGISGKEGKQAVNASDFAISQFRFLEELILIHGRWNFFRLSTVVLFSFYKNAVMAGTLVVYAGNTLYSGTPLYDEWVLSMLNFVASFPILFLGLFDRCLGKEYVKAHPEVFRATRENELITSRTLCRWVFLVFVHIFTLYYFVVPQQSNGGGITSAWKGLMHGRSDGVPGDGEGGDLQSIGTIEFACMIILLSYKVLFESKSLIHGRWPAFTCKEGGEGFHSRLAYTWIGATYLSIGFFFFAISTYQVVGRRRSGEFSDYVDVANHVLGTRTMSWVLLIFVPIIGIAFDVIGKVFGNLFYPTQTQVHIERECMERLARRKARQSVRRRRRSSEIRRRNNYADV